MTTLVTDIRMAELSDAEAIALAHRQAWSGAYSGLIPHGALERMIGRRNAPWWRDALRRGARVLVAEVGGAIRGYSTAGRNRARALHEEGEIYELYLVPEYQGIGLGRRLFGAARQRLASEGLTGTVVWALEENEGAMRFYTGQGGRDVAEGAEVFDGRTLRKIAFVWR